MRIPNDHYLIIDVEATCSNDGAFPRHEMEIIEIGAVIQSSRTFEIQSEFQSFVQPLRHPTLTDFCTNLTGITQTSVATAPTFPTAIASLKQWMDQFNDCLFCSWGDYDKHQFAQDCAFHHLASPFQPAHMNLKAAFSPAAGLKKKLGIEGALHHLGLEFAGSHHRGLDDARNIARIVRWFYTGA